MTRVHSVPALAAGLAAVLLTTSCGTQTSGGGNTPGPGDSSGQNEVKTYATTGSDGSYSRVDIVDGGIPLGDPGSQSGSNPGKRLFYSLLSSITVVEGTGKRQSMGVDFDGEYVDTTGDGIPDSGFDTYTFGMNPGNAARIVAANNAYDLFQTSTGRPIAQVAINAGTSFAGFNGGDADGDPSATPDGGPGLFSRVIGDVPTLPQMPSVMGATSAPEAGDVHQFIQIEFPYDLDIASLFNVNEDGNSFLGDSTFNVDNVFIEARWLQAETSAPPANQDNMVDQSKLRRHVPVVAIIGGVSAVPTAAGAASRAVVDPTDAALSFIPPGALERIRDTNVLTLIAHENPIALRDNPDGSATGFVDAEGILRLPNPETQGGGRVFGANVGFPTTVNDPNEAAAPMGFFFVRIESLRTQQGQSVEDPYFHSFEMDSSRLAADDSRLAEDVTDFNRGPAVFIDTNRLPAIDIADASFVAPGTQYNPAPSSDDPEVPNGGNVISTRPKFRIDFDKEVIPNSVGFSRRHTVQAVDGEGVVFPFNGNIRPTLSPASDIVGGLGAPLAPSIYLAVNVPIDVNKQFGGPLNGQLQPVASPNAFVSGTGLFDDLSVMPPAVRDGNGLVPREHNTLATLPRGVVPCDIYPLNQNNLQSYIVEPLVELPANSIVTLGVCMPGLGISATTRPNVGNFTRAGTVYTGWQGVDITGISDDESQKVAILPNQTVVKVNAGPMDLYGNLFYGGTTVGITRLVNGDVADDNTTGGYNVARTFKVGDDAEKVYTNVPVSPQALYLGFSTGGGGVVDLAGTGFNTNAPGGALENTGTEDYLIVSRFLPTALTNKQSNFNFNANGTVAANDHLRAFGLLSRYTAGLFGVSGESEFAAGGPIRLGPDTPQPGINEGSSGYETLARNSVGGEVLTPSEIQLVRDIAVGDFLDQVYFDPDNPWAIPANHRTYNAPAQGSVATNLISDPPLPNPPPLRFPVGLPHTAVLFDQSDLSKPPFIIEGNEVFTADGFMNYADGAIGGAGPEVINGFIQLNPTSNQSNASLFDVPPLPRAGFNSPFPAFGAVSQPKYVQTGPQPRTSTAGAVVLSNLNAGAPGQFQAGGLQAPVYQSRQQIGNFVFMTDGVNKKVYALNSNTMEILEELSLPDPFGLALTPDNELLFVTNEGDNSVSVVDADPISTTFMQELKRIDVGFGPRGISVAPDKEDCFILNFLGNTITVISVQSLTPRKVLNSAEINRPFDIALGMRETSAASVPGFQSGTYHGFVSNFGADNVLVFESGPDGLAGIGFDNIIGSVRPNDPPDQTLTWREMFNPRGVAYDPITPLDTFSGTVGCFVAHTDEEGRGVVTRVAYTKDTSPGVDTFNTNGITAGFGVKVFEVISQYVVPSSEPAGAGLDVALPDFNRERLLNDDFGSFFNLYNAGGTTKQNGIFALQRNHKYPLADNLLPVATNGPRWEPDRLYLSTDKARVYAFEIDSSTLLSVIPTGGRNVPVMSSYFDQ